MTVSFNIEYRTSWGEEVRIAGLLPESIPMHTTDGIYWTADVELEVPKSSSAKNETVFRDVSFYPVTLKRSIRLKTAGKISPNNCITTVRPSRKPC